ncbi:Sugar phosphate permease [Streptomyces sp. TLI_053]|uniref:MFS transporter n=1 Tax=Streptomyces sp. TLI_053 TaxID=1855352 RepID=UPI00087D22E6|nr:MFS transporter [Streptomyces sp. TLI_053]SDT80235.1 Sugar phosphate permease [Streptomyces sp. TLI_053]
MLRVRDDFLRAHLAIAALFCFLGFQYATWVSRLPALKADFELSDGQIGLLLMASGIGAAASFPLVATMMKRYGSRTLATVSAIVLGLVLGGFALAPNFAVLLLVAALDGVAVGFLNVAMNAQGAALEVRFGRTAMSRLHATFSAGLGLAALLASGVNIVTTTLSAHFAIAAAVLALLLLLAGTGMLADEPQSAEADRTADRESAEAASGAAEATPPKRRGIPLPSRITIWMGVAMVFGTITEGAMNDWSALYLKNVVHASPQLAPLGIAVISVMMVVARLFADGWRTRFGDGPIVRVGSTVAGLGLALALLVGGVVPALIGFACVGLGIAAVTPCVYVAAARQGSDALALVAATGTTGLLAGPAVIGFVANATGLAWGMGVVAASALVVALCSTRIAWPTLDAAPAPGTSDPVLREA